MASEIDYAKFAAIIVNAQLERITQIGHETLGRVKNELKSRLRKTFSDYIVRLQEKHSRTKTLIYRDTPQPILDFYEPVGLRNSELVIAEVSSQSLIKLEQPILLTGTGGSGKSTLMKYLLLDAISRGDRIPIFVELRQLESENQSLLDYIYLQMTFNDLDLPLEFLKKTLERGGFIVFLDGLDEVSTKNYLRIIEEIQVLVTSQPSNTYIISSRPGEEFVSWREFVELRTVPLTIEQACNLIGKLEIDVALKEKFISDMKTGLFDSHSSFFSNPLLLLIMLLTYQDSASIPADLHNFYALAFDALYFRHDASKTGYRRRTLTELPIDKCRELMSAFAVITYLQGKITFTEEEILKALQDSIQLTSLSRETSANLLLKDLITAFCMLIKEGLSYSYTHRSFQEYFVAFYFIRSSERAQEKLCDTLTKRLNQDQVLDLAHGMNSSMIERVLILPFLAQLRAKTKFRGTVTKTVFYRFLELMCERIGLRIDREDYGYLTGVNNQNRDKLQTSSILHFIRRRFSADFQFMNDSAPKPGIHEEIIEYLSSRPDDAVSVSAARRDKHFSTLVFKDSVFVAFLETLMSLEEKLIAKRSEEQRLLQLLDEH